MKKTPLLNIALSRLIASLGHGDILVIGDAGLPVPPPMSPSAPSSPQYHGIPSQHHPDAKDRVAYVLLAVLLGIGITDARHYIIPDEFTWGGLAIGLAVSLAGGWQGFLKKKVRLGSRPFNIYRLYDSRFS